MSGGSTWDSEKFKDKKRKCADGENAGFLHEKSDALVCGLQGKRPGQKYFKCTKCDGFVGWEDELKKEKEAERPPLDRMRDDLKRAHERLDRLERLVPQVPSTPPRLD